MEQLDALCLRAEAETENRAKTKRPTWAPAVVLDGELVRLCVMAGRLGGSDKPVARLWGIFADPNSAGMRVRRTYSKLPLDGYRCRGFELIAGTKHKKQYLASAMLNEQKEWVVSAPKWAAPDERSGDYWRARYPMYMRMNELAIARLLTFAGAPETERQAGSRLTGAGCICGRHLTDPISIERGMGPECIQKFGLLKAAAE